AQDKKGGVYPPHMMRSLRNLFDYMAHFVPPYAQGACYAYSNIGWALLSMASLRLNSLDTEAFVTEYDQHLKQFCSRFDASDTSVFHPCGRRRTARRNCLVGRLQPRRCRPASPVE